MITCKRFVAAGALLLVFALSNALTLPLTGCAEKETDPAKALLAKSVKAMGGEKNSARWKTMTETGELTVHWPGWGQPQAACTRYTKRPDKMILDQDFSANDNPFFFTYYYNGGDVWAMVNLGVRQHPRYTSFMSRAMKNTGGMCYYYTECDSFFLVADVPDDSLVTGSTVDRLGIVDDGDTILVDLDKETHLPTRRIEPGGDQHVLFADYRKAGKLTLPYQMTVYQNGAISAEYVWNTIEFDQEIDDAKFEEYRPPKAPEEPAEEPAEEPVEETDEAAETE